MKTCNICGAFFINHSLYANHVRWKHNDQTEYLKKTAEATRQAEERRRGKKIISQRKCKNPNCNNTFEHNPRLIKPKKFCSVACANIVRKRKAWSYESKQKLSLSLKNSDKAKIAFQNSNARKIFSSKEERRILEYLQHQYPQYKWTHGGAIKFQNETLVRDAFSPILKLCIEYDGIWHFKDIHGQLKTKQLKDKLLNEWCVLNNWKMIRISESYWESINKDTSLIDRIITEHSTYDSLVYFYC